SLDAAVLLAMIGLVWLAVRNRAAPQVGYGLFLLVPLKLLLPVVVTVPAAVARWTPSVQVASWLVWARAPERVESPSPVRPRTAAVGAGRSVRPGPPSEVPAKSDHSAASARRQPASPTMQRPEGSTSTSAGAPARPVAEAPALSTPAGFLIAWLVG